MQTIITRRHPATNTKGARFSATTTSCVKLWMPEPIDCDSPQAHAEACIKMLNHMAWPGEWIGGGLNEHGDMVWVSPGVGSPVVHMSK